MAEETITLKIVAQDLASGNISKAIAGIDKMAQRGGIMGSVFQGVGMSMGMMLNPLALMSRGFDIVTDIMGDSAKAASALNETQSKLDQVYDESADTIRAWAQDSAVSMGLSQQEALESAATMGNFLQALGSTEEEAGAFSTTLTQLAGDLASFNNQDPTEVLMALRSGLAGETEPMRRLGVDLSENAVKMYLMAQGVEAVGGQFTQAQKIQARYALIMNQTTKAQGDFIRTGDQTANMQRTLAARTKDAQARFGTFANEVTRAATGLAVDFVEGLVAVADGLDDLRRFMDPASAAIEDQNRLIREQAKDWGLNAEEVLAFANAKRQKVAQDALELASQRLLQAELDEYEQSLQGQSYTQEEINARVAEYTAILEEAQTATSDTTAVTNSQQGAVDDLLSSYDELLPTQRVYFETLVGAGVDSMEAAGEATTDLGEKVGVELPYAMRVAKDAVIANLSTLPAGIAGIIKDGKETVREAMTELRFAMEHPFAEEKYADWLQARMEKANTQLLKAIEAGNIPAANAAAALRTAIQAELQALEDQTYSVQIMVDPVTGRRRSDVFTGRASGGPVFAGQSYIVGERGPELVTMRGNGYVTPNGALGGDFIYAPTFSSASPAEAQRFAQTITPFIERERRRIA